MARLLEKMKKLAVKLTEEEQDEFMEFVATLDAPVSEKAPLEDQAQAVEETPQVGETPQAEQVKAEETSQTELDADPAEPNDEPPTITQPLALDPVAEPAQAEPDQVAEQPEPTIKSEQPEPQPQEEDIPVMGYGEQTSEDDDVCDTDTSTALEDTDGENMPIDSSEIIEAQGAKTMALEAENARLRAENEQLKSKVDGAFGYSSKPSMPVKVNKLYDNTDTPIMHK